MSIKTTSQAFPRTSMPRRKARRSIGRISRKGESHAHTPSSRHRLHHAISRTHLHSRETRFPNSNNNSATTKQTGTTKIITQARSRLCCNRSRRGACNYRGMRCITWRQSAIRNILSSLPRSGSPYVRLHLPAARVVVASVCLGRPWCADDPSVLRLSLLISIVHRARGIKAVWHATMCPSRCRRWCARQFFFSLWWIYDRRVGFLFCGADETAFGFAAVAVGCWLGEERGCYATQLAWMMIFVVWSFDLYFAVCILQLLECARGCRFCLECIAKIYNFRWVFIIIIV